MYTSTSKKRCESVLIVVMNSIIAIVNNSIQMGLCDYPHLQLCNSLIPPLYVERRLNIYDLVVQQNDFQKCKGNGR